MGDQRTQLDLRLLGLARDEALHVNARRTEPGASPDRAGPLILLAQSLPQALGGVPGADQHRAGLSEALAGVAEEALRLRLDRVLERAAVDLHGVGNPPPERAGEDRRAHHQMVGQSHVRAHRLDQLAHSLHVCLHVSGDLGIGAVGKRLGFDALVAILHVDGQQTADIWPVHGARRTLAGRLFQGSQHQPAAVPVPRGVHERLALRVALLAEQVHLVSQPCQSVCQARVVDVGAGPAQQVAVEDEDAQALEPIRLDAPLKCASVTANQLYRLRTPSTGREVLLEAVPGEIYRDRDTGEEMEIVGKVLPLAPDPSKLPWAVENLRFCPWCDQLAQKDLNDCPTCGRRMGPLGA